MKRYLQFAMLGAALLVGPGTAFSEDHRRYEDRAHHDSHEWNNREDEAYRRYLKERHREYRDFNRLNRREQERYWEWRHREMRM